MSDKQLQAVLTVVMATVVLLFILFFIKFNMDYRIAERELDLEERAQRQIEQVREGNVYNQDGLP